MVTRSRAELLEFFDEQIGFLERSNHAFDEGHLSEAKRMATTLRVLIHNTRTSHALVNQLDFHDTLTWVDTAGMPDPENLLPEWGLVQTGLGNNDGKGEPIFRAPLDDRPPKLIQTKSGRVPRGSRIPLNDWWIEPVVRDADGELFSRRDFVLALANKEGGAHVDPEIYEAYNKIAKLNSMGWTYSEGPEGGVLEGPAIAISRTTADIPPSRRPKLVDNRTDRFALANPVPFIVRQISHEVVKSACEQRDKVR